MAAPMIMLPMKLWTRVNHGGKTHCRRQNIAWHPSFWLFKPRRLVRKSEKAIEKALGLIENITTLPPIKEYLHDPWRLKKVGQRSQKTKRLASEQAMELHDLIEDRLPDAYDELMGIAQATYDACKAWDEANQKLNAAQAEAAWPGD